MRDQDSRSWWTSRTGGVLGAAIASAGLALALVRWHWPAFLDGPRAAAVVAGGPFVLALVLGLLGRCISPAFSRAALAVGIALGLGPLFLLVRGSSLGLLPVGLLVFATVVAVPLSMRAPRGIFAGAALLGTLCALSSALWPGHSPAPRDPQRRIVWFGLDAANWQIVDRLRAAGELPNLGRLIREGVSGTLHSPEPTLSPRAWTSLATGKQPSKHGIEDFFCTQDRNLHAARVWDVLHAFDYTIGLFQYLVTWPPQPLDPYVIPGWMARDDRTYPATLAFVKDLEQAFQNDRAELTTQDALGWARGYLEHGLRFSTCWRVLPLLRTSLRSQDALEKYGVRRRIQLLINQDLHLWLDRTFAPDFSAFVCYGTDNLAHKFWKYTFPEDFLVPPEDVAKHGDVLPAYYREVDRGLGEWMQTFDDRTTLVLVSDHGFGSRSDAVDTTSGAAVDENGAIGMVETRPRMEALGRAMGFSIPRGLRVSSVATRGYFGFVGEEEQRESARQKVCGWLDQLVWDETGEKLFARRTMPSGEVEVEVAPTVRPGTTITGPSGRFDLETFVDVEERNGAHTSQGLFVFRGPGFARGKRFEGDAELVDVVPTLLAQQGLPVADDFDGRVLTELFLEPPEPRHVPSFDALFRGEASGAEDADLGGGLEAQLREIGYLERKPGPAPEKPATGSSRDR